MKKVAVLKGGLSSEREVSLVTGAACAQGLREAGFDVVEVDVGHDICARLAEIRPNVCFNALHGPLGEDGSIQGLLNILDIPYTHSGVAASSLAMDKARAKMVARGSGLHVAGGRLVGHEEFQRDLPKRPYVIKPVNEGSSIKTFVVRDPRAPPFGADEWPFSGQALVEDFIDGIELTVTVLGPRALTVTEIVPAQGFYDFKAKYSPGGSHHVLPARISGSAFETCMQQALVIHHAIGCRGISRSDFILDKNSGEPVFLEINTQPGMTPTSLAPEQAAHVGISFSTLMKELVAYAQVD